MIQQPDLPRNKKIITVILIIYTLNSIVFKAGKVNVALFAIEQGAGPVAVGLLVSILAFFPMLLAVYAGKVSDIFPFRYPVVYGSLGMGAAYLLPFLFPYLATLYASQLMLGSANIFFHVAMHNLFGSIGDDEERTRNFSMMSLGASASGFLGPVMIGFSIDHFGHTLSYLFLAVLCAAPLPMIYGLPTSLNVVKKNSRSAGKRAADLIKMPLLRRTLLTSGIVITGIELYSFYFPIYGHSIGLSASMIGVVMAAYAAASFVIRAILPGLVRKLDEDRVLSYSLFLSGGTFLLFPFFQDVYLLSLISFILGLGLGCGQPLSIMLTYNRSPQGRSGEALGMRLTVNKLTQIMIPLVFGSIGSAFGLFPVFWGNAFLLLAGGYASVRKIHAEGSEFFEEKGKEG